MPVYNEKAIPTLNEFQAANEEEGNATKKLLAYMQDGGGEKLMELSEQMEQAHNRKMELYNKLQEFRIDK